MAYAAVAQAGREVQHEAVAANPTLSHALPASPPQSPPTFPDIASPRTPGRLDHSVPYGDESVSPPPERHDLSVKSLLKSLSQQPYEMIEGDEFEEESSRSPERRKDMSSPARAPAETMQPSDPPIRTASISRHLPLNHPTPDLQSLQGALVKNVERLEESAERLSRTSSLDDELNKMKQDQRRLERQSSAPTTLDNIYRPSLQRQYSNGSWSNSIAGVSHAARTGGYSPAGYISPSSGSLRSPPQQVQRHSSKGSARNHPLPEPFLEGRPLQLSPNNRGSSSISRDHQADVPVASPRVSDSARSNRPATAASNDTYHQTQSEFENFDGVHYSASVTAEQAAALSRQISLQQPPLARDSRAYREPQPGERMIYYPAPVPVMLNLPQRLSKMNISDREKRRLQALSGIPDDLRKSAAWLDDQDPAKLQGQNAGLRLPPQLRASAFFEQPGVTNNLKLKNGSAVQTLDSILDAAAHAPVSAFTDHPIAGQLGKEVYGPNPALRKSMQLVDEKTKKRQSSLSTMLKTRRSSTGLSGLGLMRSRSRGSQHLDTERQHSGDELDPAAVASISPDADEIPDGEQDEDDDTAAQGFSTAPTTLLAELQMRKAQQKLRTRTAADAFPNGMHSTLLEMDAVTQLQQKARKTKHVTLAWEDHNEMDKQNFDHDDVPLGVLFAEKDRVNHPGAHRTIGLMEKRELEDNEPLSHRRARLRGEPLRVPISDTRSFVEGHSVAPNVGDVPGLSQEALLEDEEETLAQRAARIKNEKTKGTGGQFTEEVASVLGLHIEHEGPPLSKTPDLEETLAQRRQRLKEEAASQPQLRSMHSLANILQAHPVGVREQARPADTLRTNSNQIYSPTYTTTNWGSALGFTGPHGSYANMPYMNTGYGIPLPGRMQQPLQYGFGSQPYMADPRMGPPLDPKQRAQIDNWRQSVAQ